MLIQHNNQQKINQTSINKSNINKHNRDKKNKYKHQEDDDDNDDNDNDDNDNDNDNDNDDDDINTVVNKKIIITGVIFIVLVMILIAGIYFMTKNTTDATKNDSFWSFDKK